MKKTSSLYKLLIILLFSAVGMSIFSQGNLEIKPYAGYNIPLGEFSKFSTNGTDFGLAADYSFTKYWGIGFDFNHQSNDFNNPFDFSKIPPHTGSTVPYRLIESSEGKWSATTFGFGPQWQYRYSRVSIDAYLKAGITMLKTPEASTVFDYDLSTRDLFRLDKQNSTAFGITSGLRFNYDFSNRFSAFINPQYVYGANRVEYSKTDIDPVFVLNSTSGEVEFNPNTLLRQTPETYEFNPSYFNVNVGITFRIGKPRTEGKPKGFGPPPPRYPRRGKKQKDGFGPPPPRYGNEVVECTPAKLDKKSDQKDYSLDQEDRPEFKWNEKSDYTTKPKKYILRLVDENNNILYTQETKNTSIKHSKKIEAVYKSYATEKNKKIYWDVESQFEDCESQTSERNSFNIKSKSSGLDIDLTNIECGSPAFNEDGTVNYTGQIVFTNSANNSNSITIPSQIFNLTNTSGGNSTDASQRACSGFNFLMIPLTLAPGQSATYCMTFKRPFGETTTAVHVDYHQTNTPGLMMNEISSEKLPNCVCNVCKDDWTFLASNKEIIGNRNGYANARIKTDIQILNSDLIQEVKAEIVSVTQKISDENCYTCTKEDDHMALFSKNRGRISSSSDWENNGKGELTDENNDQYGNMFTWKAKSPGVDFTTPKNFSLSLNLPENSSLDCCNSNYTICVRYTFTNINCETCSYLVCYDLDTKDIPNNDGPIIIDSSDQENK